MVPALAVRSVGTSAAVDELRQLTERDRYDLEVLAEHQVLTAEQIARLKFTDENTARKRLILLQRRRVLDRFRDGVRPGSQAWRYTLGPVGAAIIAAGRGTAVPRPATHAELAHLPTAIIDVAALPQQILRTLCEAFRIQISYDYESRRVHYTAEIEAGELPRLNDLIHRRAQICGVPPAGFEPAPPL